MIELLNIDCMEYMKSCKDKEFDLAIVDPPYGLDEKLRSGKDTGFGAKSLNELVNKGWDIKPSKEYFTELFRVSKNQIIWGGNYFIDNLYPTQCFLIWDKMNGTNDMADAELAWTSYERGVRMFRMHHFSKGYGKKIHPTQKPIQLYKWILKRFATEGMKILDTHLGSGSIAIACYYAELDFVGCEIDKTYYDGAMKRFKDETKQTVLF
jgi:site-specific DNA-methyltransferase (adenine-specific)